MSKISKRLGKSIVDLPVDCFSLIVSYCNSSDMFSIMRICKSIHKIVTNENFIGTRDFEFGITGKVNYSKLSKTKWVKKVTFRDQGYQKEKVVSIVQNFPLLKSLDLKMTSISCADLSKLECIRVLETLKMKNYNFCGMTEEILKGMCKLNKLELFGEVDCIEPEPGDFWNFCKPVKKLTHSPNFSNLTLSGPGTYLGFNGDFLPVLLKRIEIVDAYGYMNSMFLKGQVLLETLIIRDGSRVYQHVEEREFIRACIFEKVIFKDLRNLTELQLEHCRGGFQGGILETDVLPKLRKLSIHQCDEKLTREAIEISGRLEMFQVCLCSYHPPKKQEEYEVRKFKSDQSVVFCSDCKSCAKCNNDHIPCKLLICSECKLSLCEGCIGDDSEGNKRSPCRYCSKIICSDCSKEHLKKCCDCEEVTCCKDCFKKCYIHGDSLCINCFEDHLSQKCDSCGRLICSDFEGLEECSRCTKSKCNLEGCYGFIEMCEGCESSVCDSCKELMFDAKCDCQKTCGNCGDLLRWYCKTFDCHVSACEECWEDRGDGDVYEGEWTCNSCLKKVQ